ncbi:cupin domain-containing protein [Hylemonella sp. W303a]|uniref:cupin domain-containing protein n=1 Tax=Hylemonella sp. W303a TaxID=3389873 RepID=UPI00396AF092
MNPPAVMRLRSAPDIAGADASEDYFLAPEKLITGNPKQTLWMHYTDPTKQYFVGVWRSEPGKWRVHYTEEEYCRMLDGVSIITDEWGQAVTVRAGDEFVVPRGFVGTWEVVETTTKRFVIYEKKPG